MALFLCLPGLFGQLALKHNFENLETGAVIPTVGWSTGDATASVVIDAPQAAGNKVVRVSVINWNSAIALKFDLPAGANLSQFTTLRFKGFFQSGDVGWKDIRVQPYGATEPATHGTALQTPIGAFNRALPASSDWETINITLAGSASVTGTVWLGFGMHTSIQGTTPAVYFVDDVELIAPGVPSSINSVDESFAKVYSSSGVIVVNGRDNQNVQIYSMTGAKLFETASAGTTVTVSLPKGVYVVLVDKIPTKVIVK